MKRKTILFELQSPTELKNFADSTQSAKKKTKVFTDKVFTNQGKLPFFLSTNLSQDKYLSGWE